MLLFKFNLHSILQKKKSTFQFHSLVSKLLMDLESKSECFLFGYILKWITSKIAFFLKLLKLNPKNRYDFWNFVSCSPRGAVHSRFASGINQFEDDKFCTAVSSMSDSPKKKI